MYMMTTTNLLLLTASLPGHYLIAGDELCTRSF